jgi:hypothetical protein
MNRFQVKPVAEVVESMGRNTRKINTNKLQRKCYFYFCLPGKIKFDHMLVLKEHKL